MQIHSGVSLEFEAGAGQRVSCASQTARFVGRAKNRAESRGAGVAATVRFATPDANYRIYCETDRAIMACLLMHENNSEGGAGQFQKDGNG
jgi:hypothetical protein